MSAVSRSFWLLFPLVVFATWGVLYVPGPHEREADYELAMDGLPPLPAWAMASLPDFSGFRDITEKKAAFFSFLYPRIVLANSRVLMERHYLTGLMQKDTLNRVERTWLDQQVERLRVDAEPGSAELYEQLLRRLDVIPPALIMAQAANESAWGTSRFATEGNNLFGQWCFSRGCGLIPLSRVDGAKHEVAKFDSPYRSVRSYIQNLNRHASYRSLRNTREQARQAGTLPSGADLAQGLIGYSERGADYVREIRSMISHNNLGYYDHQFAEITRNRNFQDLQQLVSATLATSLLPDSQSAGKDNTALNEG